MRLDEPETRPCPFKGCWRRLRALEYAGVIGYPIDCGMHESLLERDDHDSRDNSNDQTDAAGDQKP